MPTFTAIALDRLLESGASRSMTNSMSDSKNVSHSKLQRKNSTSTVKNVTAKKHSWTHITPALYATPEATPLPDSPSSFPPSPYIINHKRRGPRLLKSFSEHNVSSPKQAFENEHVNDNARDVDQEVAGSVKESSGNIDVMNDIATNKEQQFTSFHVGDGGEYMLTGLGIENDSVKCDAWNLDGDGKCEDFFDPRESMSYGSNTDGEENSGTESSVKHPPSGVEFFDAWDEISSEGTPQPFHRDAEVELREIRLSLLMEIEKRKQAEEALNNICLQQQKIREQLSLAGLTLPADPCAAPENNPVCSDSAQDLCQQVYVARYVSDAIGRGTVRAEVEMEMEAQIESKKFEIARLLDRLHYYEAVNQEMSQRNQETIEMARRQRQKRKRRQKWIWGSIVAAITLGSAALAWSYTSSGRGSSPNHSQASESNE